ncbi:RNA-directed DNA polymerase, eukaryota, partial [Tanacetum coccineum]
MTTLVPCEDRYVWTLDSDGVFSVASIRKEIDGNQFQDVSLPTRWVKSVPIKVNIIAWKVKSNALPTRFNISRRGMDIDSIVCPICNAGVESTNHIFFQCVVVRQIMHDRWYCDLNGEGLFRVKDIRLAIDEMFVNFVPIKVNVLVWRARLDRIPTKINLINRGISLDSDLCPICGILPENTNHIFFRCELSRAIGRKICNWWNINWSDMSSFADWDSWFAGIRISGKAR